jgi:hypothetical protein
MRKLLAFGVAAAGVAAIPALAVLTAIGVAGSALACITGGTLSPTADIPLQARGWIAVTKAACPELPEPWIAAVMAQESGFDPDAYAADANGGTWGLFQLNASVWQKAYGAGWDADRNHDGLWDVRDPEIHSRVAGTYLCDRLAGVRAIRTEHPDWPSTRQLTELDALVVAHNAGEARLATYPAIPAVTAAFLRDVADRVAAWSVCLPGLGAAGQVVIPPGTPRDVAQAIRTSLAYVGVRSGWYRRCDRLVCRAYGYANSGYETAAAHWQIMVATGNARPRDRCPPVGAFVFWATGGPGHVALVVEADPSCDPNRIRLVSNDVLDAAAGDHGGVYLVTLAQIESGFVRGSAYLGWSDPICAGAALPAGTVHPVT